MTIPVVEDLANTDEFGGARELVDPEIGAVDDQGGAVAVRRFESGQGKWFGHGTPSRRELNLPALCSALNARVFGSDTDATGVAFGLSHLGVILK